MSLFPKKKKVEYPFKIGSPLQVYIQYSSAYQTFLRIQAFMSILWKQRHLRAIKRTVKMQKQINK